jgi:hypothetical protein
MGDEEKTKDGRQTCKKLGSGVLGVLMGTYNGHFYFFSIPSYSFTSFQVPVQNLKIALA